MYVAGGVALGTPYVGSVEVVDTRTWTTHLVDSLSVPYTTVEGVGAFFIGGQLCPCQQGTSVLSNAIDYFTCGNGVRIQAISLPAQPP